MGNSTSPPRFGPLAVAPASTAGPNGLGLINASTMAGGRVADAATATGGAVADASSAASGGVGDASNAAGVGVADPSSAAGGRVGDASTAAIDGGVTKATYASNGGVANARPARSVGLADAAPASGVGSLDTALLSIALANAAGPSGVMRPLSDAGEPELEVPAAGTVERWAYDYILSTDLGHKLAPPAPPDDWQPGLPARRLAAPGRPARLFVTGSSPRTPGRDALRDPRRRAQLYHTFLHHELQAAELMAWALLAYPDAPPALRRGLLRVACDEIRHVGLYRERIAGLGYEVGEFPVRDWFWQRVPACGRVEQFLAVMGVGLEGGNLDHAPRFAERLREAGDPEGARVQELVCEEEIPHVRLAVTWLHRLCGHLSFEGWSALLPPPLSPLLFRGRPLNLRDRSRAGLDADFVGALDAWQPEPDACARSPGS